MSAYAYQKWGVQLNQLKPESKACQFDLFMQDSQQAESQQLMQTIDRINRRYPKSITLAATGLDNRWQTKRENVSPHYTTDWRELVGVRC